MASYSTAYKTRGGGVVAKRGIKSRDLIILGLLLSSFIILTLNVSFTQMTGPGNASTPIPTAHGSIWIVSDHTQYIQTQLIDKNANEVISSGQNYPQINAQCIAFLVVIFGTGTISAIIAPARGNTGQSPTPVSSARDDILDAIDRVPGIQVRAIMGTVNRTNGVVQYNLRQMETNKIIFPVSFGHLKGYFTATMRKLSHKELVAIIAARHPVRQALMQVLTDGPKAPSEIAADSGISVNRQ